VEPEFTGLLARARELSWAAHGRTLEVFLPGMFVAYGRRGRYPAVSITGRECQRRCGHCNGRLLETMLPATTPGELLALGQRLWAQGQAGMLLSGGGDATGRLPWAEMLPAIAELGTSTGLTLTAHVGRVDLATARTLKAAGVSQALVDVVGAEETAREVLRLADGLAGQAETLHACAEAGLEVVPHIIVGLHHGLMLGEERALEQIAEMSPRRVVFVVFMPMQGTGLAEAAPPTPTEVARLLARARLALPQARHHLGCARPRGRHRRELDPLAVAAGVNALALCSDEALAKAAELGLAVSHHDTCCSLAGITGMAGGGPAREA
jgi:uncharacterized radical SAM superfamily protein